MSAAATQLHQMARRHHATMKKLNGLRERFSGITSRAVSTLEVGSGAWLGGLMDGKLEGSFPQMSLPLGAGFVLLDFLDYGGEQYRSHFGNIGMGLLSGYIARAGYRFGQNMGTP